MPKTSPTQMRLEPDYLASLDRIKKYHGLESRTDAVRMLIVMYDHGLRETLKELKEKK